MADKQEELEPLFDYTRVQPQFVLVDDDDDDDDSTRFLSKRTKNSSTVEKVQEGGKEVVNIDDHDDLEDEWLASPPKLPVDRTNVHEDSFLKKLRQTQQELLSLTESTEDIEEIVKRDLKSSMDVDSESTVQQPSKPVAQRQKMFISIQGKDGQQQLPVYKDDKFEKIFKRYADYVKRKVENLVFTFDGDKINPTATPSSLDMEEDDMIEVHIK
ncbi:uncharacterized protein [Rutidosis leptorrhynchoides]|uniref:uncharacterized protein n=1 Tax=Rutidosis leptorrhynchoides TaxID=125765 RepID=UPI003A99C1AA